MFKPKDDPARVPYEEAARWNAKHDARFRALAEEQERRALAGTGVKPPPPSKPPAETGR